MIRKGKLVLVGIGAAVTTLALVLLILNVGSDNTNVSKPVQFGYGPGEEAFRETVSHLLGPGLVDGNRIEHLENGVEIFPAMLEAIEGAEETVNFETYVYWTGEIADRFAEALASKAAEGVEVRVLLDAFGARKMEQELLDRMEESGVIVEQFRPLKWYNVGMQNNRTHRKLLVVDGRIGFTGGVGIGDEWQGDARNENEWRDSHFRVTGPVVAQMQAGFADNWMQSHGEVIEGPKFFPDLEPAGSVVAQAFNSSAEGGTEGVRILYLLSIAAAREQIRIGTPYFVPDSLLMETLMDALKRGVEIQMIVPGRNNDSYLARFASRTKWGPLLEAGAEIFTYNPTLYHTKVLIVDDLWVSVGSPNFDMRSFRYNDENVLNALNEDFARVMNRMFDHDLSRSSRVTYQQWRDRPWTERFMEWWTSLLATQL